MADLAHELTEEEIKRLERQIKREYKQAVADMEKKLADYLEKTEAQRKVQEALLNAGKITEQDYKDWVFRHTMMGKQWEEMRDVLAEDMVNANKIAMQTIKGKMPDVYALNANYATYQIETGAQIDTAFTLYNHDTAEYLLKDQRQLMPKPSAGKAAQIAANKDMQWNMKKIQSAVLQGVLQGESVYDVAHRLQSVGQMNYNNAVRYARTMSTSAQNAGRYEAFRRAESVGVKLTIEWSATLDNRTRHDHRQMHGQRRDVDEPFVTPDGFSILYPADCSGTSDAPQKEIWNCRCTLLSWVKGFEGDTVKKSPKMDGMTFEEWQNAKAPKPQQTKPAKKVNIQQVEPPQNVAPQVTPQPQKDVIIGDKLAASLGDNLDEFKDVLANASDGVADLYTNYSGDLTSVTQAKSGVYHSATKSLEWRYNTESGLNKYETLSHEFGHHVDAVLPSSKYTSNEASRINSVSRWGNIVKESASSSDEFLTAMRADRTLNAGYMTNAEVRAAIRKDLLENGHRNVTAGVQDAFDGWWSTQDTLSVYLPWGHGNAYYNRVYNRRITAMGYDKDVKQVLLDLGFDASNQTKVKRIMRDYETSSELWANIQAAKTVGGEALTFMEKYFPNACAAFDSIIMG